MTTPLVYVHDGAIDEFIAGVLLQTASSINLKGIVVTDGDCIGGPSMEVASKIQSLIGRPDVPLGLSAARAVNPFPWSFREDCLKMLEVDLLQGIPIPGGWPAYPTPVPTGPPTPGDLNPSARYPDGDALLASVLDAASASAPVTLLVACPLTAVATALRDDPSRAEAIGRLVWMGGVFDGATMNLVPVPNAVGCPYASWNAYWDPGALYEVLTTTSFPITIVSVNVTRAAPLLPFYRILEDSTSHALLLQLAEQSYAAVIQETPYSMWDTLTGCAVLQAELFAAPSVRTVSTTPSGYYQGVLVDDPKGRPVDVLLELPSAESFYSYVFQQLAAGVSPLTAAGAPQ